jgi:beta-glucosidase
MNGPIHSLVAFQRLHLAPGESREVALEVNPRSLASVDDHGERSILQGTYHLSVGSAQPGETSSKSEVDFTVRGAKGLPR